MRHKCVFALICLFSSCTGAVVHKRDSPLVEYYLNAEANELTETAVRGAFARWDEATHFTFSYKGRNRAGLKRDRKNTVSFLTVWPADVAGKTAFCRNWYDGAGSIVESDIIFNMEIARFTTAQTKTPDSYYIEGVLSHEIGHMIGLDHSDSSTSLMKPFSSITESYFIGEIDEETLTRYRSLYGRL